MSDSVPEVPTHVVPAKPLWKDVEAALEFLELPQLQRFALCDDNWDSHHERLTEATNVLKQLGRHTLARYREKKLREDRVERGMLEHLCEQCNAEIPEDSDYCVGEDATICASCGAANLAEWKRESADRVARGMCAELCSSCFQEMPAGTEVVDEDDEDREDVLCASCADPQSRHALRPLPHTPEPRP